MEISVKRLKGNISQYNVEISVLQLRYYIHESYCISTREGKLFNKKTVITKDVYLDKIFTSYT